MGAISQERGDSTAAAQPPRAGEINIDHISHFVPDIASASLALEKLGFALTPLSEQYHRLQPDAPLTPAGSANRCIMLKRGYLEFLTPTAETGMGAQLRAALARYVGVHVIAFGTSSPDADHKRLADGGFTPAPPVALQREIGTPDGERTARFTVVRVPPDTMPEGRIQYCAQLTPEYLWQPRWLGHENRVTALRAVLLCVTDPAQAAQRYGRYTGLTPVNERGHWQIDTARGRLLISDAGTIERAFNVEAAMPPSIVAPSIVGYALASDDLAATRQVLAASGYPHGELPNDRCYVVPPGSLGGILVYENADAPPFAL